MKYPKEIRVELEDCLETIIIVHSAGEYADLLSELDGSLPYMQEFETTDGNSVDGCRIERTLDFGETGVLHWRKYQ